MAPLGELELIGMLEQPDAIVMDSRESEQYPPGTIPGAVNIPFAETLDRLDEPGCKRTTSGWDCSEAKPVALFCNGVWCGRSPTRLGIHLNGYSVAATACRDGT